MLLAYFFVWAGILIAIGLITYNIFMKFIVPKLFKKVDKLSKFMMSAELGNLNGEYSTKEQLLANFIQGESLTKYKQSNYRGYLAASLFQEALKKLFTVEVLSQVCEWDKRQCAHSMKLTGKDGNTFYLAFNTGIWNWQNSTRALFKKVYDDGLTVELADNNSFEAIQALTLIHGVNVIEHSNDMQDLYAALNMAEIERIMPQQSINKTTNVCRFAYHSTAGYYLQDTSQEIKLHTEEVVNASYNDMLIDYEGHKQLVTPSQAMEIARAALLNKRNAFVFGKMGCGKTTFARQVLARLEDEPNVRLISIAPSMIGHLQNPQAQSALVDLLATKVEVEKFNYETGEHEVTVEQMLNVILIDEAETLLQKSDTGVHTEAQAFLLSMMDGELRDVLNCQVLFVFNKSKEHLNPVIFRSMRGGLEFHVEPIDMARAKTLVGLLKLENIQLRFDEKKFHQFITDLSLASDGTMYAPAGFTTLADVVSCFTPPALDDAIISALRGMRMPKVTKKEPQKPSFKIPSVSSPAIKAEIAVHKENLKAAPAETRPAPTPANPEPLTKTQVQEKKKDRRWRGGKRK